MSILPVVDIVSDTMHNYAGVDAIPDVILLKSITSGMNKCKTCLTFFVKLTILKMSSKLYDRERNVKPMKTRIQELRRKYKLSQEELALAVGVTRQTIISLEKEKYTASLVLAHRIARYFGVTIEDVFDFSEVDKEEM